MKIISDPEHGRILLEIDLHRQDITVKAHGSRNLEDSLASAYVIYRDKGGPTNVTLEMDSRASCIAVCRAIFRLWQMVHVTGGSLVVTGYPAEYAEYLEVSGVNHLPGLSVELKGRDVNAR